MWRVAVHGRLGRRRAKAHVAGNCRCDANRATWAYTRVCRLWGAVLSGVGLSDESVIPLPNRSHQITCELELRTHMASGTKLDLEDSQYKAPYWFPPTCDPLNVWPHQWYPAVMNPKWAALYDWSQCPGYASGTVGDTGYEDFVLNYTFSRYGHLIPSSYVEREGPQSLLRRCEGGATGAEA